MEFLDPPLTTLIYGRWWTVNSSAYFAILDTIDFGRVVGVHLGQLCPVRYCVWLITLTCSVWYFHFLYFRIWLTEWRMHCPNPKKIHNFCWGIDSVKIHHPALTQHIVCYEHAFSIHIHNDRTDARQRDYISVINRCSKCHISNSNMTWFFSPIKSTDTNSALFPDISALAHWQ